MISRTLLKLPSNPGSILFVCTGNSCRSVMAEALFSKMLASEGMNIRVYSAGTEGSPGRKASPPTLELLNQEGLDYSHHNSRKVTRELLENAGLILVMEDIHRKHILTEAPQIGEKVFLLSDFHPEEGLPFSYTEIPDPIGMSRVFYENVIEMIRLCCQVFFLHLKENLSKPTLNRLAFQNRQGIH